MSTITDEVALVRNKEILCANRRVMWFECPLVSPQEIWVVEVFFGFQPNPFIYQMLEREIMSFGCMEVGHTNRGHPSGQSLPCCERSMAKPHFLVFYRA